MSEVSSSYLSQLKFDEKLRNTFRWKYITNIRIVLLFALTIVLLGIFAFLNLPRRLNPEIKIPIVSVTTIYPGAAPSDIESLVTIPIEDAVAGVAGISTITSSSQESVSSVVIEFTSGIDPKTAESDVARAVDRVGDLPEDAQDPRVVAFDFENQPVWTFALKGANESSLYRFADELRTRVEDVGVVDRVSVSGLEEREIQLLAPVEKLTQYGISPLTLSQAISGAVQTTPLGSAQTERGVFSLSVAPSVTSIEELRALPVTISGTTRFLSDLVVISERTKPLTPKSYYSEKGNAVETVVVFNVYKTSQANIDTAVDRAREEVSTALRQSGNGFNVIDLVDTSREIETQFGSLAINFRDTLILVFITLFIFLGVRQAAISALTIPLTFFITFAVMQVIGLTLNFLSLFALLLALGLLVDDTIVVVTAMTAYFRTGKFSPAETGQLVWKDFIVPIWTTTIATVWAFVPLLLSGGIIGEFIKTIPIVVAVALYTSTAIAVLITLPLMVAILDLRVAYRVRVLFLILTFIALIAALVVTLQGNTLLSLIVFVFVLLLYISFQVRGVLWDRAKSLFQRIPNSDRLVERGRYYFTHGVINSEKLSMIYKKQVLRVLATKGNRRRTVLVVVLFFLFSVALLPLGFVKNEFFPKTSVDTFYVNVELPSGTSLETSDAEARRLVQEFSKEEGVNYVTAQVGQSFSGESGGGSAGFNTIQFTFNLPRDEHGGGESIEVAEHVRQAYRDYDKGVLSVVEQSGGPPVGSELQIKLFGDDLTELSGYADRVAEHLNAKEGVINVQKSIKEGTSQIQYVPNRMLFADTGLPAESANLLLRTFASGFTLDTVRFAEKEYDAVLRVDTNGVKLDDVTKLSVTTPVGSVIPLSSLGEFKLSVNPTRISREDGKRTISVSANVRPGFVVSDLNTELEGFADSLQLPEGYSWSTGGVNEENARSVNSILQAMVLALVLILITMIIQFSSFREALIVTLVIPPAIAGVFFVFGLTGVPLSFPALIGVLALYGIVVNNAIQLVSRINDNRKAGLEFTDAIADAGASRFEPILFGSLTTIVGLIPITIQDPLWRGLGGAIIAGLLFSGTIMLFLIPVVYYMWFDNKQKIQNAKPNNTVL